VRVYVDTNVLYLILRPPPASDPLLAWVREWADRFASGLAVAVVTPLVVDELLYRLLLALARDAGSDNLLADLRQPNSDVIARHGDRAASLVSSVLALPGLEIAGIDGDAARRALEHVRAYRLLPRDAMHVAAATSAGCDVLLSSDPDFARARAAIRWIGPGVTV